MRPRCLRHGLAVGPDGECALCHSQRAAAEKPHPAAMLVLSLMGLALCAATFFILRIMQPAAQSIGEQEQPATVAFQPLASSVRAVKETAATAMHSVASVAGFASASHVADPSSPRDRDEHHLLLARDPRASAAELHARGETDVSGTYDTGKESYELFLPADAVAGVPHGLLVWISSDPSGAIPNAAWRSVLAAHHLVWVGPNQAGNQREIALRIGLALDAAHHSRQRFNLDEKRVYVGGVSGGAKSALRALLFYPEVFRGALLAAGAEYIRPLAAKSRGQGAIWPQRIGVPRDLALAKTRPIALTTGPTDFNYGQITDVVAGMHEDNFAHAQIFSWQELGHGSPPPELLDRALTWLQAVQ